MIVELSAADGHTFTAYEAGPPAATAAIVVVQEIFGVNDHIRAEVDRYGAMGYWAIAPALFDRVERCVELDYSPESVEKGKALRAGLEWDDSMLDVTVTVQRVAETGPVGVVGYCYGGSIAWLAAASLPVAAVSGYYGGQVHQFRGREPQVPVQLHFGALDQGIPLESIAEVHAMHPDIELHIYDDAGHGFNCDLRGSFHSESASLARGRTVRFFKDHGID